MQNMARQVLLVLALVFFAAVGMASAAASTPAAAPVAGNEDVPDPFDETVIGNAAGGIDAAPVGGPVPAGAFADIPTAQAPSPTGGAASLEATAAVGVGIAAAVAGSFFF